MPLLTSNRRPPQGFVLIMALVVIGIAGLLLARLSSESLSLTTEARLGERELQRRWALLSCQTEILRDPEQRLGDLSAELEQLTQGLPYPRAIRGSAHLGGVALDLLLTDEQAKTNLNLLYVRRPESLRTVLFEVSGIAPGAIRTRPLFAPAVGRTGRPFESLGQAIDLTRIRTPEELLAIADQLTCWGPPRLNVTRAEDAALERVAGLVLNPQEINALLAARKEFSGELEELLKLAEIPRPKAIKVRRLLTDRSTTHALWIMRREDDVDRLSVSVSGNRSVGRSAISSYQWP